MSDKRPIFIKTQTPENSIICCRYEDINDLTICLTVHARFYKYSQIKYEIILSQSLKILIDPCLAYHDSDVMIENTLNIPNRFSTEQEAEEAVLKFLAHHNIKVITQDLMPYT